MLEILYQDEYLVAVNKPADVPITFRGSSIALITAGLMSLAFMGFAGLVK